MGHRPQLPIHQVTPGMSHEQTLCPQGLPSQLLPTPMAQQRNCPSAQGGAKLPPGLTASGEMTSLTWISTAFTVTLPGAVTLPRPTGL